MRRRTGKTCKAISKRTKIKCNALAVATSPYGLCRNHFGNCKKLGVSTIEDRNRISNLHYKHGKYSKKTKEENTLIHEMMKWKQEAKEL